MSKYSKLNENQRNHGERISAIEKLLKVGEFTPLPSWAEFQKKADDLVILTKDDEQRLTAYQSSLLPIVQRTIQSNPQNTPEKKNRRKDWSRRISDIKVECNVSDKALRTDAKDKGKNWRSIVKAAKLEITDINESQNLPYPGTIAEYLLRIYCALDFMVLDARLNNKIKLVQFYKSRCDQLIAIWFEIDKANPRSLAKLKAKYADIPMVALIMSHSAPTIAMKHTAAA